MAVAFQILVCDRQCRVSCPVIHVPPWRTGPVSAEPPNESGELFLVVNPYNFQHCGLATDTFGVVWTVATQMWRRADLGDCILCYLWQIVGNYQPRQMTDDPLSAVASDCDFAMLRRYGFINTQVIVTS